METAIIVDHRWPDDQAEPVHLKLLKAKRKGRPGLVWLGGFRSDMTGTKAQTMVQVAAEEGLSSLRFDYSGHGESSGDIRDGCISQWVAESLAILRGQTDGPQILVGSSMGGWVGLRLAQELAKIGESDRLAGLFLIAPAPDFTHELMKPRFTSEQNAALERDGFFLEPTPYSDEPNIITKRLIDDGAENAILGSGLVVGKPVHILQGSADPDVPADHAQRLMAELVHDTVSLTLVPGGDHRLSREPDIALLRRLLSAFFQLCVD